MPADPTYLCWQGSRNQDLPAVIADARQRFTDRYGIAPQETLIPATGDATLGRPVDWLFYRDTRWHVAAGPVPVLAAAAPDPAGYEQLEAIL